MAAFRKLIFGNILKRSASVLQLHLRCVSSSKPPPSTQSDDISDEPVKFSTSKAATWKAETSFTGREKEDVTPSYQPLVIVASLAVFLIYFGILREENDIDQQLSTPLHHRIDGLEELQLKNAIEYYKKYDRSYDTRAMEQRLNEIRAQKEKIL